MAEEDMYLHAGTIEEPSELNLVDPRMKDVNPTEASKPRKAITIQENAEEIITEREENVNVQYEDAAWELEQVLRSHEAVSGESVITADILSKIGIALHGQGRLEDARKKFERALNIYQEEVAEDDTRAADLINYIGLVSQDQGMYAAAIKQFERALAIQEKVLGKKDVKTAETFSYLAKAYSSHVVRLNQSRG